MKATVQKFAVLAATVLFSAAMLAGCGSDDKGSVIVMPAPDPGAQPVKSAAESCATCHGAGKTLGADVVHGNWDFDVKVDTPVISGADLVFTANVKSKGVGIAGYTNLYKYQPQYGASAYALDANNDRINLTTTFVNNGGGKYTITVTGGAARAGQNLRYLFIMSDAPSGHNVLPTANVLIDYPAAPGTDLLGTSKSCEDCHGNNSESYHYGNPAYGGKACTVCHNANQTQYPKLPGLIHGIHNSGKMPSKKYTASMRDGSKTFGPFSVDLPTYMQNCSICHQSGAPLAAANAKPVTYSFCMTCHENWTGFGDSKLGGVKHDQMTAGTNCATCHDGSMAADKAGSIHNKANDGQGMVSGRGGLIVDGVDLGVTEGAKIDMKITGVTRTGNNLAVNWSATYNGAALDPCNATPAAGKPAFAYAAVTAAGKQRAVAAQNFSFLVGFFQGDDLVNANNGNEAPGQPNAYNFVFTGDKKNTSCSGNVATTTITLNESEAKLTGKGRIGMQGKPMMVTAAGIKHLVRAKSPVYDFNLADGKVATQRREVADSAACLKCHVGSLYQHGGNRVDSVQLCVICHNESSSDQNTRTDWSINKDNSYDRKTSHTYGFKSLLHKIHASGTKDKNGVYMLNPFAIYRPAQGVYGYSPDAALLRNWPGTGSKVVFGSNPAQTKNHTYVKAHYPRPLQDCAACHVAGFSVVPDPTKAIATTVDAGSKPWDNQLDDTLIGPATAACTSCHTGSAATAHAYQNSWAPAKMEKGRQTVIDSAK